METPLDIRDWMPTQMAKYISNYGWHFSKEACQFAVSLMRKKDAQGKSVGIPFTPKNEVQDFLKKQGIVLENDNQYDAVYVYHMCKADYAKSIPDDAHLAWYIKETIDDIDSSPETTFRKWRAAMDGNGKAIPWYDFV